MWVLSVEGLRVGTKSRRLSVIGLSILLIVSVILAWPLGTWLQGREMFLLQNTQIDAVYLVAGAKAQDRRVAGLVQWLEKSDKENAPGIILVGNDPLISRWSRKHQRNLAMTEWAVEKISVSEVCSTNSIEAVPGEFCGTDDEMEALSAYLDQHTNITTLAIVTSPFHVRRVLNRLDVYLEHNIEVKIIPIPQTLRDRYPWIVALELIKMGRDALGLSRHTLLSRRILPSVNM